MKTAAAVDAQPWLSSSSPSLDPVSWRVSLRNRRRALNVPFLLKQHTCEIFDVKGREALRLQSAWTRNLHKDEYERADSPPRIDRGNVEAASAGRAFGSRGMSRLGEKALR
jgi:hypothetical protein